jgi:hypothetical protein
MIQFDPIQKLTMSKRPLRRCSLYLQDRLLCKSHLLPKAMYKTLRSKTDIQNPNPILIGGGVPHRTSEQAQDYLLCEECEDRFRRLGENWVLANCYRGGGTFRLRDALEAWARCGVIGIFGSILRHRIRQSTATLSVTLRSVSYGGLRLANGR